MDSSRISQTLPPLAAYGKDLAATETVEIDPGHERWLHVALYLWRIGTLASAERQPLFAAAAETLSRTTEPRPDDASSDADRGLERTPDDELSEAFAGAGHGTAIPAEWSHRLVKVVEAGADYLEKTGALRLAYSLLTALRAAVERMPLPDLGRVVSHQGRIARRLGALQTADDHYAIAERLGRKANEPDIRVRAMIGRGAVAGMRGNYPKARLVFNQALRAARASHLTAVEALAHQGLLTAAVAAKDADCALVHGWEAFNQSADSPDRQAELAIALAEVALLAEHPDAAFSACMHAINLTTLDHVRLAAYGSAALAAARLGRRDLLDAVAADARIVAQRSQQLFDKAYTMLELAEAYKRIDADAEARSLLTDALTLATAGEFYELLHRAEQLSVALAARPRRAPSVHEAPIGVDRAASAATGAGARLSPASRSVIRSLVALGT